jgi:translation initiation factor IF-2
VSAARTLAGAAARAAASLQDVPPPSENRTAAPAPRPAAQPARPVAPTAFDVASRPAAAARPAPTTGAPIGMQARPAPVRRPTTAPAGPPPRTVIPVPALPTAKASAVQPLDAPRPGPRPARPTPPPAPPPAAVSTPASRLRAGLRIPNDPVGEPVTQIRTATSRTAPAPSAKKPTPEPDEGGQAVPVDVRTADSGRARGGETSGPIPKSPRPSALQDLSARFAQRQV